MREIRELTPPKTVLQARLFLFVASFCLSFAGVLYKTITWNVMVFNGARAVLIFIILYFYMGRPRIRVNKATLIGASLNFITAISFQLANRLTTAANAITILYTNPMLIALFTAVFFHEKLRGKDIVTAVIISIGVGVCFVDGLSSEGALTGNFLALLCAVATSFYFLHATHTKENVLQFYLLSQIMSFTVGIPFFIFYPPKITIVSIGQVVAAGMIVMAIPQILISRAFKRVSALEASLLLALEPILNPLWVALFLGETPTLWSFLGAITVIAGVLIWCLSERGKNKEKFKINEKEKCGFPHS